MRDALLGLVLVAAVPSLAQMPPEVELALQSLRPGEKARLEKQLGPVERLPLYRVDLELDPVKRTASGQVSIVLTPAQELSEVHLRSTPNAAHPRAVVLSALEVDGKKLTFQQPDPSLWRVAFAQPVAAGQAVTLTFKVTAKVPAIDLKDAMTLGGADKPGDYGAFSTSPDVMNLDGIVPMVAPLKPTGELMEGPSGIGDLGTFDPSNFIASVAVPSGWRAVLPGVLSGEVLDRSGRPRFTYALAGARELPVLAVRGYESLTKHVGEVTVEAWHATADTASGKKVLEHAAKSLELLEAKLGPTPYKTFRVVEAHFTGGAGGMEFPGLVTVSSTLYHGGTNPLAALGLGSLGNDPALMGLLGGMGDLGSTMTQLFQATLEFTVEHEVAHQYFAMLIGNDPISDPLADEALTQHVALLVMEWRHGKGTADQMRDAQMKMAFQMYRMMGGKDGPANRPTFDFESNTEYAALVYGKAPLLYDGWRKKVGDEAWVSALRAYVEANRYKWVTSTTLLDLMQKRHPAQARALATLRTHWWDEVHGDEDLGSFTGAGLAGTAMPQQLDPQMLKEYEALLKQLMGEGNQ